MDSPALPLLAASPATGLPSISGPGQGIEQVMAAQLASMTDLINRQLETLRQLGGAAPLAGTAVTGTAPIRQPAPAPLPEKPLPEKNPPRLSVPSNPSRNQATLVSTRDNAVSLPI